MLRQIADALPAHRVLFELHPSQIAALLDVAWDHRAHQVAPPRNSGAGGVWTAWAQPQNVARSLRWNHLIYAYMVEATGAYEIFRRVVHEYVHGELLGVPRPETQAWLRTTEELFFREPTPFSILSVASQVRPDLRATRRNAYHRMFGMDLTHGNGSGGPYPAVTYVKTDAANSQFQETFDDFLREAWVAIENIDNTSGANPTDESKLSALAESLQGMLLARRLNENLAREELAAVSTMAWFHLTLLSDNPLIEDLRAQAISPAQRLFKIAQKVGLPAHTLSHDYFTIADPISQLLLALEDQGPALVPALRAPGLLQNIVQRVVTHWSVVRGVNVKAKAPPVELVALAKSPR